jgi:alpha-ribazole phosphatase/probable phosphoglycerate mutase
MYSKRIIIVRHGRTDWNDTCRFQGRSDVPLNDTGLLQSEKTARRLAVWPIDAVYTSPLARARRTASDIAVYHRREPIILEDLAEMNFGYWEGRDLSGIREEKGGDLREWYRDPFSNVPDGAETWDVLRARVERAVGAFLDSPHKHIAVVAHGGIIRVLYVVLLDLDPRSVWNIRVSNCAISGIEVRHGEISLAFSNDELHLRETKIPGSVDLPVW